MLTTNDTRNTGDTAALFAELEHFRETHIPRRLTVNETTWAYYLGGDGPQSLLILPGDSRYGEIAFKHMVHFEQTYRVITPTYPLVSTIEEVVDGLANVLDITGTWRTHILAEAFGGIIAQYFVRKYPDRVDRMVLTNTSGGYHPEYIKYYKNAVEMLAPLPVMVRRPLLRTQMSRFTESIPAQARQFWRAFLFELNDRETHTDSLVLAHCIIDAMESLHFTPDDLAGWPGHVMIIESDNDHDVTTSMRARLRALYPQASVHLLTGAGDMPAVTRQAQYFGLIEDFLKEDQIEAFSARLVPELR